MALMMSRKKGGSAVSFEEVIDIGFGRVDYDLTGFTHLKATCVTAIQYITVVGTLNGTEIFRTNTGDAANIHVDMDIPANSTLSITSTGDSTYAFAHHKPVTLELS